MLAEGGRAYITIYNKPYHFALGEGMLLASDLYVTDVARDAEWYEHHQIVPVEQALAFGGHGFYCHALKKG